ncbi:histone acetyltransferases subunit 3-domain-containing protein [Choanephora cucurbitarum]|nr:histone acetyltransferases subunit 3-domain-containing protein [Choanephora cucurbitarum]
MTFESLSKKRGIRKKREGHVIKLRRLNDMPSLAITVRGRKNRERTEPVVPIQDEIPILTFWSTLDPYFRPLTEEDRAYLMQTEQDPADYSLTSLDKHSNRAIHGGGLTERVLNSLLLNDDPMDWIKAIDTIEFEERLKQELVYVGLLEEEEDEISAEFRLTLNELREQYQINRNRKQTLLCIVDNQLQYEQYQLVLNTLDVQVEQAYLREWNASSKGLSNKTLDAMNKRKAWIDGLENIFKDKNSVMPHQSIY